ncbi:hypothetical protein Tco_1299781 [Tanacetum coccineum]
MIFILVTPRIPAMAGCDSILLLLSRFVMASNMLNREARFLSSKILKLRETVFRLKGEQSISSATIARLEAKLLSIRGGSSVIDSVTVHGLMSENEKLKKDIASPQELS